MPNALWHYAKVTSKPWLQSTASACIYPNNSRSGGSNSAVIAEIDSQCLGIPETERRIQQFPVMYPEVKLAI